MKYVLAVWFTFSTVYCNTYTKEVEMVLEKKEFVNWSINNKPKHTWDNVDWLAKMMMSEVADSTDKESIYLVGAVAVNHTTLFGYTLFEALHRKQAFSGLNNEAYHWWRAEPTTVHKQIAIDLITNGVQERACNVFAFCNMSLISKHAHNWFSSFKLYKKIGQVSFFSYEKAVNLP
jgi:hypothetical protein